MCLYVRKKKLDNMFFPPSFLANYVKVSDKGVFFHRAKFAKDQQSFFSRSRVTVENLNQILAYNQREERICLRVGNSYPCTDILVCTVRCKQWILSSELKSKFCHKARRTCRTSGSPGMMVCLQDLWCKKQKGIKKHQKLSFFASAPYTHRGSLVWVPWCDSRNQLTSFSPISLDSSAGEKVYTLWQHILLVSTDKSRNNWKKGWSTQISEISIGRSHRFRQQN